MSKEFLYTHALYMGHKRQASHKLLVNKQTNLKQMHEPEFMKKIQRKKRIFKIMLIIDGSSRRGAVVNESD